jgi:hypothetical protein
MGLTFEPGFVTEVRRRCRALANSIEAGLLSAAIAASERREPARFNQAVKRFRDELNELEQAWNDAIVAQAG